MPHPTESAMSTRICWTDPFDQELHEVARQFGAPPLLRTVIAAVDEHGLKRRPPGLPHAR